MAQVARQHRGAGIFFGLLMVALQPAATVAQAVPPNDTFASAIVISGSSNTVTGSNIGGTAEIGEPAHAASPSSRSVWWFWTARVTGSVSISTVGSSFDTVLGVYVGASVTNLIEVASDDDGGTANTSQVLFRAIAGESYHIAVDGFQAATGTIRLQIGPTGQAAPPWALTDVNGNALRSADLTNKVLLIDFWETICGACVEEVPYLTQLQSEFGAAGFQLVGFYENSGTAGDVLDFMLFYGVNYLVAEAMPDVAEGLGGVGGFPTKYIVDREYKVVKQIIGGQTLAYYETLIRPLLRGSSEVSVQARAEPGALRLLWPGTEFGYVVESADNLSVGAWAAVPAKVEVVNGQHSATLPVEDGTRFYRLRK